MLRDHELNIEPQEMPKIVWVPFTRRIEGGRDERFGGRKFEGRGFSRDSGRERGFSREGPRTGREREFPPRERGSRVFPERSGDGFSSRSPEARPREGFENRVKDSEAPGRAGYTG
ncbi:MAG: hypothetical protein NTZ02_01595, partial [Candidatus Woesearchaeota archaeon]|nr:hypothetical protein [Candidatus Woesearchaeota archaeon]